MTLNLNYKVKINILFIDWTKAFDFWESCALIYFWFGLGLLRHVVDPCLSVGWGPLPSSATLKYGKSKLLRPQHKHASVFLQLLRVLCVAVPVHNSQNALHWRPNIVVVNLCLMYCTWVMISWTNSLCKFV